MGCELEEEMTLQELANILHAIEPRNLSEAALGLCIAWWFVKGTAIEAAKVTRLHKRLEEIEERIRLLQERSSRRAACAALPHVRRRGYKTRSK
jgi:hypothetical protein